MQCELMLILCRSACNRRTGAAFRRPALRAALSAEVGMSRSVLQNQRDVPLRVRSVVEATLQGTPGWPVYHTIPSASAGIARHVVFLHGGSYLQDIAWSHWRLVNDLTCGVPARCIVPIFPLAPGATASEVVPAVGNLLRDLLKEVASERGHGRWQFRRRGPRLGSSAVAARPWLDRAERAGADLAVAGCSDDAVEPADGCSTLSHASKSRSH